MNDEVLAYLRCPATKQPLRRASADEIASLNARIEQGEIRNEAGNRLERTVDAALVTEDGRRSYPIWDDIVTLIADEAIVD